MIMILISITALRIILMMIIAISDWWNVYGPIHP